CEEFSIACRKLRLVAVPRIVPTQPRNGLQYLVLARMDVAGRDCDRAMPGDSCQCPCIAARLAQPRQKSVPQRVENKRAHLARLERLEVLAIDAVRLDVAAPRSGRPHPAFFWLPRRKPAPF